MNFLFRNDWLTPVVSYVYDDKNDQFERPPYIAHFQSSRTGKKLICN